MLQLNSAVHLLITMLSEKDSSFSKLALQMKRLIDINKRMMETQSAPRLLRCVLEVDAKQR